jgi:hypothetical protein
MIIPPPIKFDNTAKAHDGWPSIARALNSPGTALRAAKSASLGRA